MDNTAIFPECDVKETSRKIFTFKSIIHIHKDFEQHVRVYSHLIENTFAAKNKAELEEVKKAHLKECFRLSKYLNTDLFDTSECALVTVLDKESEDFLHKLHYIYP